jgi:DNA adenine methylase
MMEPTVDKLPLAKLPNCLSPAQPANPPAGYIGGKRLLSKRLIEMIKAVPHEIYAEPFVGMGGVFLRRPFAARSECINDISGDVVNLFRILQRHYPQFMDTLRFQLTSRKEFERLRATDPKTLTDFERAARFLYLQRLAFGGKVEGRNFGIDPAKSARFNVLKIAPMLEEVHERLSGVVIENLPWAEFIRRYDRPGALFYLDPPYWGGETDYGKGVFARADYAEMATVLAALKGRFILSINDRPEIREVFSAFTFEEASITYSVGGGERTPARELIFRN